MKRLIDTAFGPAGVGLTLGLGLPGLLAAWSDGGNVRARSLGLIAAVLLGAALTQLIARRRQPGPRVVRGALLLAGIGLPLAAELGERGWPSVGAGDVAGLTAGMIGGAIGAAPLWLGLGVATAWLRPTRLALPGALAGALAATPFDLPATMLPLVSAGLILIGLIAGRQLTLRSDRRTSGSLPRALIAGLTAALAGLLVGATPALLAPHGVPPAPFDPLLAAALAALGLAWSAHARPGWSALAASGLIGAILLLPAAAPPTCAWAGAPAPSRDGSAEVSWTADGAAVLIVEPLDRPRRFVNGHELTTDVDAARQRLATRPGRCPDADGEERAAAEAVLSGNRDQAIARARLAVQICAAAPYARPLLGALLLDRGVEALRTGRLADADRDLTAALELLDRPAELARANLAHGLVLLDLKRPQLARERLARVVEIAPAHPAAAVAARRLGG